MGTADCYRHKTFSGKSIYQETTNAKEPQINIALTLTVSGYVCNFHLSMDIKADFIFISLLRANRDCCHPKGPGRVTLYYHIKT